MAPPRKYQLVIQIPIGSAGDFDRLIEAEERIDALLMDLGRVEGHDTGAGIGNLLISTDHPQMAFQKALPCLDERVRDLAKVAYRERDGEQYTVLWPADSKEFRRT
jgi:hypothetical protein